MLTSKCKVATPPEIVLDGKEKSSVDGAVVAVALVDEEAEVLDAEEALEEVIEAELEATEEVAEAEELETAELEEAAEEVSEAELEAADEVKEED